MLVDPENPRDEPRPGDVELPSWMRIDPSTCAVGLVAITRIRDERGWDGPRPQRKRAW